jgi:hypothetical protein
MKVLQEGMEVLSLGKQSVHNMEIYVGVEASLQSLLISVLVGGELSGSQPGRLTTGRKPAVPTVRVGGWVQELENRKISCACRGSIYGSSVVSL